MPFNPFDKPISDSLTVEDLQKLINNAVAEGYYVEYKSDFPKNHKIGRSIASFANTYGGWYIIGVITNEHNIAKDICGFSLKTYHDPISKVRDCIKSYINPLPVFFPQVVNVKNDSAVLVVYIPCNQETPFITKDGRIYRRIHDSSDPVPETSRYSIDRLVDNGKNVTKRFKEFCIDERVFSRAEEKQGWVKIYLSPYPLGIVQRHALLQENLRNLLIRSQNPIDFYIQEKPNNITGNIPFNSVRPTYQSVMLRQIESKNAAFNSLCAELFSDGRAKLFIPLQHLPDLQSRILQGVESEEVKNALSELWRNDTESNMQYCTFFDIGKLWLAVACLLRYYQEWLREEMLLFNLQVVVTINKVWRTIPFFDSDEWSTDIKEFGIPIIHHENIRVPKDIDDSLLMNFKDDNLWLNLCQRIGLAFGMPVETFSTSLLSAINNATRKTGQF